MENSSCAGNATKSREKIEVKAPDNVRHNLARLEHPHQLPFHQPIEDGGHVKPQSGKPWLSVRKNFQTVIRLGLFQQ